MTTKNNALISVVVPAYNEAASLETFHDSLVAELQKLDPPYEVIYVNDGSTDETGTILARLCKDNVRLVSLSRNFGKEMALTAGIAHAKGQAIISLDADGQHPVELIPDFIKAWHNGAQVVVGIRENSGSSSTLFYSIFNKFAGQKLIPGSTDFRLITKEVQQAFLELPETDRITRGLIDWLGFERSYIPFTSKDRQEGEPTYSRSKLIGLAINSTVSMSPMPLYLFGGLGVLITFFSLLLGSAVFIEQILLNDPLYWNFTGTAQLSILILFFVGIILTSQGLLSLYVLHVHNQSKHRPLYVIDHTKSVGIE